MACTEEEDRVEKKEDYKSAKRTAKKAVIEAKNRAYEEFYKKFTSGKKVIGCET